MLAILIGVAAIISMVIRRSLQDQFAEHLSRTVRNDLLVGNNAAVLKILDQTIGENFSRIAYVDGQLVLFALDASPDKTTGLITGSRRVPICLRNDQKNCSAALIYHYSLVHYIPWVLLVAVGALLIFLLVFWIFRQHVAAYYREQLKSHKEAALGRLSARICHDLKLPSMIFQRVAYLENASQFMEMKPQLQSHLQRLYAMIEKLKKAELEGLVRMESHTMQKEDLQSFLSSIAPQPQQLQIDMPNSFQVYLDLDKFERALANLVLNAFQAGAKLVKVIVKDQKQDLLVHVENNGPEMPRDIVQSFLHGSSHHRPQSLGLRMVQDTVRAHGGHVDLDSNALRTRFTLCLPKAVMETQTVLPQQKLRATVGPVLHDRSTLIWVDENLLSVARSHIPKAERDPFDFTSDPEAMLGAQLLISRDEQVIDFAIDETIPIIMVGASPDDFAWVDALKSRLRLLKLKQSRILSETSLNNVQLPGHNPPVLLH
ncbi:MAG TPA: HAMP domain-containing sensor histidine kinase [Oligoflexus sp.]|uniref:sensor histidine kinase n=1 Tax=Oligoflexus sp. TaxID=1971216 RepID=UPI002D3167A4|nr:HAMP domain-containing sensor histidine kinase [Oligoflexus sp.]HYX31556.1 HAMP domain-containing sensor histidine kinase [Oligoflexus sp.]